MNGDPIEELNKLANGLSTLIKTAEESGDRYKGWRIKKITKLSLKEYEAIVTLLDSLQGVFGMLLTITLKTNSLLDAAREYGLRSLNRDEQVMIGQELDAAADKVVYIFNLPLLSEFQKRLTSLREDNTSKSENLRENTENLSRNIADLSKQILYLAQRERLMPEIAFNRKFESYLGRLYEEMRDANRQLTKAKDDYINELKQRLDKSRMEPILWRDVTLGGLIKRM